MVTAPNGRDAPRARILVAEDDEDLQRLFRAALEREGWDVTIAQDGARAFELLSAEPFDLVLSDILMPNLDGLGFLTRIRTDPILRAVPVVMLTTRSATRFVIEGLHLGADDYLVKPIRPEELVARVRAKLERPPVPADALPRDLRTGLLRAPAFLAEAEREALRARRSGAAGCVASLDVYEMPRVREHFGARGEDSIAKEVYSIATNVLSPLDIVGRDRTGRILLLLPDTGPEAAERRLHVLAGRIGSHIFLVGESRVRLTPVVGFAVFGEGASAAQLLRRAGVAQEWARRQLDLVPLAWRAEWGEKEPEDPAALQARGPARPRWVRGLRTASQIAGTFALGILLPFLAYLWLGPIGPAIARAAYLVVVVALVLTCLLIWTEGFQALRRIDPPDPPSRPYPPASAIIAAYLPNEAATIEETVRAFLALEYPAPLEVILAYNTPRDLPVEEILRQVARENLRLRLLRVPGSESKAQNVNAALSEIHGEFVGVFDADHHPDPGSFQRAWRWLANGFDVIQGHCVIRNGDASWVSRLVAVEFEQIYAVSHPGRSRLHGFGIFGGSNGYWKTSLLQETRMHGFMLTEDIDSSLRTVASGGKIASDPLLVSRELAPTTLRALWNQRLRWAQGWFQVSVEHFLGAMRSRHLTPRSKLGVIYLLLWREVFPWLSLQIAPIVAFWAVSLGGFGRIEWWIPVFIATTLFTLGTGPGQLFFTYRLADPQIRKRRAWFWIYMVLSILFYTGFKNLIGRIAQVKELMREKDWRVTPRT